MAPKLAVAILAAAALTTTSTSAWPSIFDRKPAPSSPHVDVHGGVWSEPAVLVAEPDVEPPRPPHHPHHPHPPHDPSHDAERRECFESLKKACPFARPEHDADLTKRLETDLSFLQCVEKADPTLVKPECAGRASTFVVFHDLHLVEGRHPHPPPPDNSEEKKDTPCQSELKKKCGKQIDEFKAKLKEARVLGAIHEGIQVVQCLINNAADLVEKCKKTPSILETPELAAVQGFAGAVDLPAVAQNCEQFKNLCPFEVEFSTLPAFRQSASVFPAHLTCLWSNRVVIGDCLPVVIEDAVVPTSSSNHCKDEFKHACGKHIDDLKKHAKEHDVVGVLKASLEVAECVVSNAEKLFKACTHHRNQVQVDPAVLPQDNVMTIDDVVAEEVVVEDRPEPLEADEDCASRIEAACPSRKTFAAVQIYSAETYASALSEKLARVKCVEASVDVIGSTCAAVYAQQLGDIESAVQGEKHPCKDQLHKSCGKQLDSFEKAIKDTSVIGIISGAIDVVECVLQHVEDIWSKCKPLEGEEREVSVFLPSSDVLMASTKKPTPKSTKKPTPKPTTKKPTPKSTPKPTSKRVFEDYANNEKFPVLDQACLDAVAERCSGLINRLASDYAPGAHEELAEQARACIVKECGEDQAMLLLRPDSGVSFTIKDEEEPPAAEPKRFPLRCGNVKHFAQAKRAEIVVLLAAIFALAFFIKRRRNMRLRKEQEEARRQEEAASLVSPSTVVVVVDNQDSEYFRVKEDGRVAMGELA